MTRTFPALAAAVLLSAGSSMLLNTIPLSTSPYWGWPLLLLAILFMALSIYYRSRKTSLDLVPALIGGFVARFLFGLVFLLAVFLIMDTGFFALALHFMAHWFLFTLAEIAYLTKHSHTSSPQS